MSKHEKLCRFLAVFYKKARQAENATYCKSLEEEVYVDSCWMHFKKEATEILDLGIVYYKSQEIIEDPDDEMSAPYK